MAPTERAEALRQEIRVHKSEIRRRRGALVRAKSQIVALEAECAARGIRLVVNGEEENSWPNPCSTSTP